MVSSARRIRNLVDARILKFFQVLLSLVTIFDGIMLRVEPSNRLWDLENDRVATFSVIAKYLSISVHITPINSSPHSSKSLKNLQDCNYRKCECLYEIKYGG